MIIASVCLFVCPLAYLKYHTPKFTKFSMLRVAVAGFSANGNVTCYVLPVLRMTSCFYVIERMGRIIVNACFVEFAM